MTLETNGLLLFGGLLLLGFTGAALAARTKRVPGITGMLVVGFIAGPSVLGLVDRPMLSEARIFVDVALGLILFQLGLMLDVRDFLRERVVWLTAAAESVATFLIVFAALATIGIGRLNAGLAAAVAVSSSPAVLLLVVRELNASGPVTALSLKLVAFNNVMAFLLFSSLLPILHYEQQAGLIDSIGRPLLILAGSALLGLVLGYAMIQFAKRLLKPGAEPFSLVVAVVLLALGLAKALALSPLLGLLAMGLAVRNLDSQEHLQDVQFGRGGELFFLILFVFAGANLHVDHLMNALVPVLVFITARFAAKSLAVATVTRLNGFPIRSSALAGFTLLPMAGMAIGLVQSTEALYPEFATTLSALVLGAVAILETIGPVATEFALKQVGEVEAGASVSH